MATSGAPGHLSNWTDTALWRILEAKASPDSSAVIATLTGCMPDIQKILAQGGTAPTDFTLHDSQHAFRVAEQMVSLIPSDLLPNLSVYEVALLLLSAYLHDIGMTPEQRKVSAHHSYLITGAPQDLSKTEIDDLQEWLDNAGYDIVPPLSKDPPSPDILRLANEMTAYYCRHRHNDWSESWIRNNLTSLKLGTYIDWIDDLVALCRSHHESYNDLIREKFNPRNVGAPPSVVHLRYLAVVLRVADILEFDPERTPEVILRHRDIAPESLIYWWKDRGISLVKEDNRLLLSARPKNAQIHHAIETMANDIDRELQLSRTLADMTHFEKFPGLNRDLPHRWEMLATIYRDIKPEHGTYEYIDGAFRPDTKRLLELLSGVELYGTPFAAVRELLQNAFDAIKEQVAHERLAQPNPADPRLESTLAELHRVELRFEKLPDGYWLVCSDTGVGMTKAIIRDHLLISGTARRHDILDLDRRCKEKSFSLGRTGQFGIGVLSYFMLADRVSILTQRAQEPGDSDGNAWSFETEGIGYFGELRPESNRQTGTEARLHLRSEDIGDNPESWYKKLLAYLHGMLIYLPCRLCIQSNLSGYPKIELSAGWVLQKSGMDAIISDNFEDTVEERFSHSDDSTPSYLLPSTKRQERENKERHTEEVRSEVQQCLRWLTKEGQFPNDLGQFRFHLPYFELPGGKSLAFLRCIQQRDNNQVNINRIGEGYAFVPHIHGGYRRPSFRFAWKGVRVGARETSPQGVVVEINLHSPEAGKIKVSRDEFVFTESGEQALRWLDQEVYSFIHEFLQKNEKSLYATVSCAVNWGGASPKNPLNWIHVERIEGSNDARAAWKPVKFPAISSTAFMYEAIPDRTILWRKRPVSTMRCIGKPTDRNHYDGIAWNRAGICPDRVVEFITEFGRSSLVALWVSQDGARSPRVVPGYACRFSPRWKTLCGVTFQHFSGSRSPRTFWNPRHRFVSAIDETGWQWCKDRFRDTLDPLTQRDTLLSNVSYAGAWAISVIEKGERDLWEGLVEREPQFLSYVWELLFGVNRTAKSEVVCFWVEDVTDTRLRVVSPTSWKIYKSTYRDSENNQAIQRHLPNPGSDWCLEFEGKKRDREYSRIVQQTLKGEK
jgi:hypothetical protein